MIDLHKPEARWLRPNERHFSYTFGGIQSYRHEISALIQYGYDMSEHAVLDRNGRPMIVAALYRKGEAVKAYEL